MENEVTYPGFLQALGLTLLLVLLQMVGGFLGALIADQLGLVEHAVVVNIVNYVVIPFLTIGLLTWYILRRADRTLGAVWGGGFRAELVIPLLVLGVGMCIVLSEVANIIQYLYPMGELWREIFEGFFEVELWVVILASSVLAPILEEVFFRGVLMTSFLKRYAPWQAIYFSAFLFGLVHFNIWQGIPAFLAGVIMGWVFFLSRSLLAPILVHAAYNLTVIAGYFLVYVPGFSDDALRFQPLWLSLVGIVLLLVSSVFIERVAAGEGE